MKYMIDTNISIAIIKGSQKVLKKLISCQPGEVCMSSISLAELRYGVVKSSQQERNDRALEQFLVPIEIADFDFKAAHSYGFVRDSLTKQGRLIGPMDLLIAGHALSLDSILVTDNTKEFGRVDRLVVENWMK